MMEIEVSAQQRALGYELLAGIFLQEPSLDQLAFLKKWASSLEDDLWLMRLLEQIEKNDPGLEELQQSYYDLFFVPVSGCFVPPFEAAIRGAKRQAGKKTKFGGFWGSWTLEVQSIYQKIGFEPNQLNIFEPLKEIKIPDHIGFELLALASLCQVEEEYLKEKKDITPLRHYQRVLLVDHLNQWLDLFKKDLEQVDSTGYYTCFVQIAANFCREEAQSLLDTKIEDEVLI